MVFRKVAEQKKNKLIRFEGLEKDITEISIRNNAHLHIKCPDKLRHQFKLKAAQERRSYPELLQKMMDVYEGARNEN